MKNKYKYLLKNIGLLSISNFGGRLLSFFLIPLYTSVLSTSEYGTYDFYTTTVSLMVPILTLCANDGVLRFSLDKNNDKNEIFSIGFGNAVRAIFAFSLLVVINMVFNIIPVLNQYPVFLMLFFIFDRFYALMTVCSKSLDNVKSYAFAGFINSLVMLTCNIIFLLVFRWGIAGYFLANILAYVIGGTFLFFSNKVYRYIHFYKVQPAIRSELFKYSRPLVFNSIAWWINNVSDRYIIIWLCGTSANGVYSLAYKIPSIINALDAIFHQAWTLSAVKEFKKENVDFYTNVYKVYNFGLVFSCSLLIIFDQLLAKILYAKDFYLAWKYVPFLIISTLFACLSSFCGGIFSANKDSSVFAKTTVIGAAVNIILNVILVKLIGPMGAAISTMVTYFVVWLIRFIKANKIIKLDINVSRDLIGYALLVVQAFVLVFLTNVYVRYTILAVVLFIIMLMYLNETKQYLEKINSIIIKVKDKLNEKNRD